MTQEGKGLPPSVVKRLPRYYSHAQDLGLRGEEWVSSQEMADALGLTSSTVRQDLSYVDFSGISKRGYAVTGLQKVLAEILGADTTWKMVVVGAGNLGRALVLHDEFMRRGFQICGIFDSDQKIIGKKAGRLTIQSMRDLPPTVGKEKVDIGVIAVPAPAAQSVADLLIASGVRGLLNLALAYIVAPRRVAVVDSRIFASLLELSHAIKYSEAR